MPMGMRAAHSLSTPSSGRDRKPITEAIYNDDIPSRIKAAG